MLSYNLKRPTVFIVVLLAAFRAFGQNNVDLKFSPLDTLKIITNKEFATNYKVTLRTEDPNSVIAKEKSGSQNYLLQKTQGGKWVVYLFEVNQPISIGINDRFVYYTYHHGNGARGIQESLEMYVLINVKKHSELDLISELDIEQQDIPEQKPGEVDSVYEKRIDNEPNHIHIYNTDVKLNGGYLSLKYTVKIDSVRYVEPFSKRIQKIADNDGIAPGGIYKYTNGVLVKIKGYRPGLKGLQPVIKASAKAR